MASFVEELCGGEEYEVHGECLTRVSFEDDECANIFFSLFDDSNKTATCITLQANDT